MKHLVAGLLVVGLSVSGAVAQSNSGLETAKPESVGMSSERLERIGTAIQRYIDDGLVAGTVTLVARRGRVVHLDAQGYRDVDSKSLMTTDAIFRMASMTKPITSVALMILWEEGKVRLNDPVADYLPEFANPQVSTTGDASGQTGSLAPAESPITIDQLLTHTAGLANSYIGNSTFYDEHVRAPGLLPGDTLRSWVQRIAELPLNYHPGTEFQYSHATDVVGRVVEVISGTTLQAFFQERILDPLGMVDTAHYLDESKADRLATQYQPGEDQRIMVLDPGSIESALVSGPKTLFRGSGAITSTAADYVRFQQMMLNGGELDGVRILGRKTVELMFANHTGDMEIMFSPPGFGFGLGYAVLLDRGKAASPQSEGTGFWGGGSGTFFWVDPEEELIGVFMMQLRPYSHIPLRDWDFRNLVYQAIVD